MFKGERTCYRFPMYYSVFQCWLRGSGTIPSQALHCPGPCKILHIPPSCLHSPVPVPVQWVNLALSCCTCRTELTTWLILFLCLQFFSISFALALSLHCSCSNIPQSTTPSPSTPSAMSSTFFSPGSPSPCLRLSPAQQHPHSSSHHNVCPSTSGASQPRLVLCAASRRHCEHSLYLGHFTPTWASLELLFCLCCCLVNSFFERISMIVFSWEEWQEFREREEEAGWCGGRGGRGFQCGWWLEDWLGFYWEGKVLACCRPFQDFVNSVILGFRRESFLRAVVMFHIAAWFSMEMTKI